jgi:hypothetical protein
MAGAKQHNPGVRRAGRREAGMLAASPCPICAGRSGACHRACLRATRWLRRENHEATIGPSSLETHRLGDAPR